MSKKLVAYFSASGVTAKLAANLAKAVGGNLYEIKPETAYTSADLNWQDKSSRSTLEMQDLSSRPALADNNAGVTGAEVIFVGFPIWWYREPSIIDTFLETYDFSDKTIVPFCTSGGSGLGETAKRMQGIAGNKAKVLEGKRFAVNASIEELRAWASSLGLC